MCKLPTGSNISIENEFEDIRIIIPQTSANFNRYLAATFVFFWLGGWAWGLFTVSSSILEEFVKQDGYVSAFTIFWLGGWTVGGIFVFMWLYKLLRPHIPETIILSENHMFYDSGIPPFRLSFGIGLYLQSDIPQKEPEKRVFAKFHNIHLTTLKLREYRSGNRLTIDKDTKRYEIAFGASEVEREWLFNFLQKYYNEQVRYV